MSPGDFVFPANFSSPKGNLYAGGLAVVVFLGIYFGCPSSAVAQDVRVDAGVGWGLPVSEVEMQGAIVGPNGETQSSGSLSVDLSAGRNAYAALGVMWSISDLFAIGTRGRVQVSRGDETPLALVSGCDEDCVASNSLDGRLRAATIEGRLFLTTIDWIDPYFLVGLGIVQTHVDGATVEHPTGEVLRIEEVDVLDAGGDVGFGASLPLTGGLAAEVEVRATGALPGGKDSTVTVIPFSVGLSYEF